MNTVPTDPTLSSLPLPLPLPATPGARRHWSPPPGCGEALALAGLRSRHAGFWLVIVPSVARAESLEAELRFFLGGQAGLAVFPDTEVLPYDTFSPHQDLTSRRLMVLRDVAAGRISTLVVAASTLLPRLAPARYISGYSISLSAGQKLRPEQLRLQLDQLKELPLTFGDSRLSIGTVADFDTAPGARAIERTDRQATLTITADNQSKVYGAELPALTAVYAGLVNGDTLGSIGLAVITAMDKGEAGEWFLKCGPSGA